MMDEPHAYENMSEEEKWDLLTRPEKIGEILLKQGKLTLTQLEELCKEQEATGTPFGELVLARGLMSRSDLLRALDLQHMTDKAIIDSLTEMIKRNKPEDEA